MSEVILSLGKRAGKEIFVEPDPMQPPRTLAFWQQQSAQLWSRILVNTRSSVTEDNDVNWTPGFLQEFEKVQRSIWQRLRNADIDGSIAGPNEGDFKAVGKRREITVAWSSDEQKDIETAIRGRIDAARSTVMRLGHSLAVVDGTPPVVHHIDLNERYGPEFNTLISEASARETIMQGMDFILGQVRDIPREGEHPSVDLLRNLKNFRRTNLRWARLNGRNITSLETGTMTKAWMCVVPPDNEIIKEQASSFVVRQEGGITLMRALPFEYTKEWAGLISVHELEHLENIVTKKESVQATKQQYIEGEIRAFSVEMAAAEVLSRGNFFKGLDAVIDGYNLQSLEKVTHLSGSPTVQSLAKNLDRYITTDAPKCASEAGMRLAFYVVAVGFRIAERAAKGNVETENALKNELISFFYKAQLENLPS